MSRAPAFWNEDGGCAAWLRPVAALYGAVAAARLRRLPGFRAPVPTVVVGNLTAGGAGKTPTVRALVRIAKDLGARPAVVSRGYGGRLAGPVAVDPALHGAHEVGDEPLLLAGDGPVFVAKDRRAGVAAAVAAGADLVLLDDGFQSNRVGADLAVLVVDRAYGIGNGLTLPAGPLRAPLDVQLDRTGLIVDLDGGDGETDRSAALRRAALDRGLPIVAARLEPREPERFAGRRVLAFAGIGRPEKFAASLARAGADVVRFRAYADHMAMRDAEAASILAEAERDGLAIVTTEKDAARLAHAAAGPLARLRAASEVFAVDLKFADEAPIRSRLAALVAKGPDQNPRSAS